MVSVARTLTGIILAAGIAGLARRVRALSPDGAVTAMIVGAAALSAGWAWGGLLLAFFALSTLLSMVGRAGKEARTASIVAKGGERDSAQVLANGGVFALAAVGSLVSPAPAWNAIAAGAIAAATADTWATEIGGLSPQRPRSILTLREVAPGTSGGVTLVGLMATVIGAGFVQVSTLGLGWPAKVATGALVGGIAGSLADSLLGALVQERRWCDQCGAPTERRTHICGHSTRASGGISWISNDAVNVAATVIGGAVGWVVSVRA
jgi:uncharacterized protein (TIGR00297 family)